MIMMGHPWLEWNAAIPSSHVDCSPPSPVPVVVVTVAMSKSSFLGARNEMVLEYRTLSRWAVGFRIVEL